MYVGFCCKKCPDLGRERGLGKYVSGQTLGYRPSPSPLHEVATISV